MQTLDKTKKEKDLKEALHLDSQLKTMIKGIKERKEYNGRVIVEQAKTALYKYLKEKADEYEERELCYLLDEWNGNDYRHYKTLIWWDESFIYYKNDPNDYFNDRHGIYSSFQLPIDALFEEYWEGDSHE